MTTLRLLDNAGALGSEDLAFSLVPIDWEVVVARSHRFALGGSSAIPGFFGRQVLELVGDFRYADGPEPESTPYGGDVDALNVYISNRKIATLEFDDTLGLRKLWSQLSGGGLEISEVIGNDFDNSMAFHGPGSVVLRGRGGDDLLHGHGRDRLLGGEGDDAYELFSREMSLHERAGEGTDSVSVTFGEFSLGRNFENLTHIGSRRFTGEGNGGDNEIVGGFNADTLFGRQGDDFLRGRHGTDRLDGGRHDDTLVGGRHEDVLLGGRGTDSLAGGTKSDRFRFTAADETGVGADADTIEDFETGEDTIDLRAIDADRTQGGDQAFVWIGTSGFSGTAGEARFGGGRLSFDTDGDGDADSEIRLAGGASPVEADLLL